MGARDQLPNYVRRGTAGGTRVWSALLILLAALMLISSAAWAGDDEKDSRTTTNYTYQSAAGAAVIEGAYTDFTALTPSDCAQCHGTSVADKHHATSYFEQGQCNHCHEGVTTTGDCSQCHTFGLQNNHHETAPALSGNCAQCHSNVGEIANCLSCHEGKVRTRHHEVAAAGRACNSCHTSIVDSSNCTNCHTDHQDVRNRHHSLVGSNGVVCSSCHSDINRVVNCQSCHAAGSKRQAHHDAAKSRQIECSSCHTSFPAGTAGAGCANCHTGGGDNRVFHHGTVAPSKNFDCASCHGATTQNQLNNCRNCHTNRGEKAQQHHDAASAQNINCSTCHTAFPAGTAGDGCVNCHQAGNNRDFHHGTVMPANNFNCSNCHSGIDTSATTCASCHNFASVNPHHNNPNVDARGLTCNNCHKWGFNEWGAYDALPPTPSDCVNCHTTVVGTASIPETHHATQPALDGNCARCHSGVQSGLNCSDCHNSAGGTVSSRHHTGVAVTQNLDCSDCHGTTAAIYSVDTQCESCHTAKDGSIANRHHGTQAALADNCTLCHSTIPANLGCSDCHNSGGGTTGDRHHNNVAPSQNLDCTYCHTGADTIFASCESCHTSGDFYLFPTPVEVPDLHHMTLPAQQQNCGACHTGITPASIECAVCHLTPGSPPINERHHGTQQATLGNCTFCHTGAEATKLNCAGCHDGQQEIAPNHHQKVWAQQGDCTYCHTGIQVNGNGCQACHTAPIPSIHHDGPEAPLAQVGGDCGVCHQAVSSPKVCGNCHQSSPHHETTFAQSGDCTHCHTVPAWAQDRPKQAACRECHGQYQHNKGGPIQDYGACAACHNQKTFHPAPSGPVGYTRSAPGKGKFAMFWSQFTNNGDEEVREGVSPNGEDMGDEGGRRWRNPSLSFNKVQIQNQGRTYTVPAFPDLPGTSGTRDGTTAAASTAAAASVNLALNGTASATKQRSGYEASKANDGSTSSRWWTDDGSYESLTIRLDGTYRVNRVVVDWHNYYAREYRVRLSTDGSNWSTVKTVSGAAGGVVDSTFNARDARYVQIYCVSEGTSNGFSVKEVEIYKQ